MNSSAHVISHGDFPDPRLVHQALLEIQELDWNVLPKFGRNSQAFDTSQTLHLRTHARRVMPQGATARELLLFYGEILECVDSPMYSQFKHTKALVEALFKHVNGKAQGRIMVINLLAGGDVTPHVDPGTYFQVYKRFHVPLFTNPDVKFLGPSGSTPIHMEYGKVYQLINTEMHGVVNESNKNRIHLVSDIEV